jgi:hypothetical protein
VLAGILTDPGYLAVSPGVVADPPVAEFGGLDPNLILPDLLQIFGGSSAATDFSQVFDASALDPTAMSADLSTMLGNLGANLAPDLSSVLTSLF